MGYVLGDYFEDEPVLILKHCVVSALALDWLPPSSSESDTAGSAFSAAVATYKNYLADEMLSAVIPDYDGSGYDILAFVWFHGYADVYVTDYRAAYDHNLRNLLADMQSEFQNIEIGTNIILQIGGGGEIPDANEAELRNIQACVAEDDASNAALVETYTFAGGEPRNDELPVHYRGRADNYIAIAEAVGSTITAILDGNYLQSNLCNRPTIDAPIATDAPVTTDAPAMTPTDAPAIVPTGTGNDTSDTPSSRSLFFGVLLGIIVTGLKL